MTEAELKICKVNLKFRNLTLEKISELRELCAPLKLDSLQQGDVLSVAYNLSGSKEELQVLLM